MTMQIVTWNVNSLKARMPYVEWYLDSRTPDVLCLQELKLADEAVPRELFEARGYHLATHGQKQWNGVAIASKLPIEDVQRGLPGGDDGQARLISGTVAGVRIVNVYCPQGQQADSPKFSYKLKFYDVLIEHMATLLRVGPDAQVLLCGDLNVAPRDFDVWDVEVWRDVPTYHPLEHERWARLCALGFEDAVLPFIEPGTYSFWDYRGGAFYKNNGVRIDHHLASAALRARVTAAGVDRDARKKKEGHRASDHAPVGITVGDATC